MKTKTDATAMAREAMAGVSKSKLTLTQEAVMNYVMMFLDFIFAEFFEKRKRFYTPEAQLREDAVAEMQKDMLCKPFGSDRAMLNACYTCLSKYLWGRTNQEEGEYIVKVGNVRISKSKLTLERCLFILDNEPLPIDVRNLIEKMYVDCMTDQQIMRHYGWDEDTYNKKVKKATDRLKDSLLRSPHCYDDVLKDCDSRHITMSLEGAKDFCAWVVDHSNFSSLEDLFGVNLTNAEIQEKALELMQHISANMEWSDNDRIVWQSRFFENQSPEELADELHMRRSNVDNIYSRCKRKFNAAMQKWYETRTNCKVHKMKKETKTKKQTKTKKAA